MLAVNYSTLRNNLKQYCDLATDDMETIVVTRKNEKNIVMLSLEAYNNLMENLFIVSNRQNYNIYWKVSVSLKPAVPIK